MKSARKRLERERLLAQGEDGRRVVVTVWQEYLRSEAMGRDPEWLEDVLAYTVGDKIAVNRSDDGSFEVVETGEKLTLI